MITLIISWILGLAIGIAVAWHSLKNELRETREQNDQLQDALEAMQNGDLNRDGTVDRDDLSAFMTKWNRNRT